MRVERVSTGHRFKERMILKIIRATSRREPPDVAKTLFYRPEFFGRQFSRVLHAVMRGPSQWSVGERELMAAFTSRVNECVF
ncbi:MAG: hypothetical protein ACRDKT_10425 [Actinomycetota bacterium]